MKLRFHCGSRCWPRLKPTSLLVPGSSIQTWPQKTQSSAGTGYAFYSASIHRFSAPLASQTEGLLSAMRFKCEENFFCNRSHCGMNWANDGIG
jgi:hypothetical protein